MKNVEMIVRFSKELILIKLSYTILYKSKEKLNELITKIVNYICYLLAHKAVVSIVMLYYLFYLNGEQSLV